VLISSSTCLLWMVGEGINGSKDVPPTPSLESLSRSDPVFFDDARGDIAKLLLPNRLPVRVIKSPKFFFVPAMTSWRKNSKRLGSTCSNSVMTSLTASLGMLTISPRDSHLAVYAYLSGSAVSHCSIGTHKQDSPK